VKKICCIVFNNVSSDSRVLKEAKSLGMHGFNVDILGIKTKENDKDHEFLFDNVEVSRLTNTKFNISKINQFFLKKLKNIITIAFFNIALIISYYLNGSRYFFYFLLFFNVFLIVLTYSSTFLKIIKMVLRLFLKNFSKQLWNIKFLLKIRTLRPDIIHCHDISTLAIGVLSKICFRTKLVYDAHEIYEETPSVLNLPFLKFKYKLIHWIGQFFIDGFITINDSISLWYAAHYPILKSALIIRNATILEGEPNYDGRLHHVAGLADEKYILLYQGGFQSHRGLEQLVESAKELPDKWCLVMMGWGKLEKELIFLGEKINSYRKLNGLDDAVIFIPPAPNAELNLWTSGATIGIIPYENVGLNHKFCTPNKMWEFPNARLPVIVSPLDELRKPVDEFKNGWVLPENHDQTYLGDFLNKLTCEELITAKKNTIEFIKSDNWAHYENKLISFYRNLAL
jgi:glycosyltransferase involved in cell wall biosynthesis